MSNESILIAKAAALKKSFDNIGYARGRCLGRSVEPLLPRYESIIEDLREANPALFEDIPNIPIPISIGVSSEGGYLYDKSEIDPLVENLNYIIELQAGSRICEKIEAVAATRRLVPGLGGDCDIHGDAADVVIRVPGFVRRGDGGEDQMLAVRREGEVVADRERG